MSGTVEYDDGNLQRLFAEMEPKRRAQALRGGFRKAANDVRKKAVANLRSSIRTDKDLEKGIRAVVFRRSAGFRVTIGSKVMKGRNKGRRNGAQRTGRAKNTWVGFDFHTNRQGKEKPILIWAEAGTKQRQTKGSGGKRFERMRAAHRTGRMQTYGFMDKTRNQVRDTVTADTRKQVAENVERIAKKYGCK